jgi:transcriptional regulator with XRE-family HTH domain
MEISELKRKLGNRLRVLRSAKGMRQEDVEDYGFSYRYYGKMERGIVNPTLETLARLSDIFEITLKDLFLFLDQEDEASEEREAVALKVGEILKGEDRKIKKLKLFLDEIL